MAFHDDPHWNFEATAGSTVNLGSGEDGRDVVRVTGDPEFVEIQILSRTSGQDYWDGNWLGCRILIEAGSFKAELPADLRTDEFERFLPEIAQVYDTLRGEATFTTLEEQLKISLKGNGRGQVQVEGWARDRSGNSLQFAFATDQTHLSATLSQIQEIVRRFPVRGSKES